MTACPLSASEVSAEPPDTAGFTVQPDSIAAAAAAASNSLILMDYSAALSAAEPEAALSEAVPEVVLSAAESDAVLSSVVGCGSSMSRVL